MRKEKFIISRDSRDQPSPSLTLNKVFCCYYIIRMTKVRKPLRVPLIQPPLQQGHPEQGLRPISRQLLKISKEEILQPLGSLYRCSVTCTAQKCSWCSEGTSCAPVCARCLLSWYRAPLK